jgi:SET and MYND domain-containing protein
LHGAQREILFLVRKAIHASNYPGIYPDYEDMSTVETKLRTILANAFPADMPWPEHMEPLPSARLSLAMISLKQGKPVPALRNVLKGKFLTTRLVDGPEWVNEMMDVVTVLMVAGSLPPDAAAFEDKSFPAVENIRTVTYGYLWAMARGAERAFGKEAGYAKGARELMGAVLSKKKGGAAPGSREFYEGEFRAAQGKVLAWAGVPEEKGIEVLA